MVAVSCVGGPVFFFETWRCLFQDKRNMARVELPTKNTWRSVRTLLGNSIAQIQSIWKLNYDITNVFEAVLVKHFLIISKNQYHYYHIKKWHIIYDMKKQVPFPTSPKRSWFKLHLGSKEHSCQMELPRTCLQGGWNQHWNPQVEGIRKWKKCSTPASWAPYQL